jgi:hypothetical protein
LMRLNPKASDPLKSFKGVVYSGHFERGGKPLQAEVDINVVYVKTFRHLEPSMQKPDKADYFVLHDKHNVYLIHRIFGRPDFDQILSLRSNRAKNTWRLVKTPFINQPGHRIQGDIASKQFLGKAGWSDLHEIYFETSDLQ